MSQPARMLRSLIAGCAATLAAGFCAPQAGAFETIERLLPAVPPTAGMRAGEILTYVGFGNDSPAPYLQGLAKDKLGSLGLDRFLTIALANPAPANELTGVAFEQVRGVLEAGQPPGRIMVLAGQQYFGAMAWAALPKRGFVARTVEGVDLHGRGKDYSVELRSRDPSDPFGGGLGAAQRVVVLEDQVIVGRATLEVVRAAVALRRRISCPACGPLSAGLKAVRQQVPARSFVRAASAYGGSTFIGGDNAIITGLSDKDGRPLDPFELKRRIEALKPPRQVLPVYGMALVVLAASEMGDTAHVALAYQDKASAETAVAAVARKLGAEDPGMKFAPVRRGVDLPRPAGIATAVVESGGTVTGVISLRFDPAHRLDATREYQFWLSAIARLDFQPLHIME